MCTSTTARIRTYLPWVGRHLAPSPAPSPRQATNNLHLAPGLAARSLHLHGLERAIDWFPHLLADPPATRKHLAVSNYVM